MLGVEGIAVGMATRILPHNFVELLRATDRDPAGRALPPVPRLPDRRPDGRVGVRQGPRQGEGARADRVEGREDDRHSRDPLEHDDRVPDRVDRDRGAEGPGQDQRHRGLHDRQGRDRAVARARRVRRRGDPAALRVHRLRGHPAVVAARDPRPEAGRAHDQRGPRGRDRPAQEADQGRARVRRAEARRPPALDDARADLHREPGLQEDRDREDRRRRSTTRS